MPDNQNGTEVTKRSIKKATVCLLAYILSPEDGSEFSQALQSQVKGIEKALRAGDTLLKQIDAKVFSDSQRLLLATYIHLYVTLRSRDLKDDPKLVNARRAIGITEAFAIHAARYLGLLKKTELESYGNPVKILLNPPQKIVDWASDVVYTAQALGGYIEKQRMAGLTRQEYEHPSDRKYLETVKRTPGLEKLVRKVIDWGVEPLLKVQHTGSNIKLTPHNFPQAHRALVCACEILDVNPIPDLYIALGFIGGWTIGAEEPIIVLTSGCFGTLKYDELLFLMGHELGHIKSDHCLYHMMGQIVPLVGAMIGKVTLGIGEILSGGLEVALFNWMRMSEFTADRAGLLCCQNLDAATTAMMKLAGAPPKFYSQLNPQHFLEQARGFEGLNLGGRGRIAKALGIMNSQHPWTVMRAKEMHSWMESGECDRILERKPMPSMPVLPVIPSSMQRHGASGKVVEADVSVPVSEVGESVLATIRRAVSGYEGSMFFVSPDIPADKLGNARKSYVRGTAEAEVILLYDSTTFHGAREGCCLTIEWLYWKNLSEKSEKFRLSSITNIRTTKTKTWGITIYSAAFGRGSLNHKIDVSSEEEAEVLVRAITAARDFAKAMKRKEK